MPALTRTYLRKEGDVSLEYEEGCDRWPGKFSFALPEGPSLTSPFSFSQWNPERENRREQRRAIAFASCGFGWLEQWQ
jgi:hypothetical protein